MTINVSAGILSPPLGAFVLAAFSSYLGGVVLDHVAETTLRNLDPV